MVENGPRENAHWAHARQINAELWWNFLGRET